jgi:hypothetical protein
MGGREMTPRASQKATVSRKPNALQRRIVVLVIVLVVIGAASLFYVLTKPTPITTVTREPSSPGALPHGWRAKDIPAAAEKDLIDAKAQHRAPNAVLQDMNRKLKANNMQPLPPADVK